MTISVESFLKDPEKYLTEAAASKKTMTIETVYGDVVLSGAYESSQTEDLEILQAMEDAEADISTGDFVTLEEFVKYTNDKIAAWRAKR